ncbi:MAG: FecR domain-containing protein [Bacteroidota bacterium]
MNTWKTDDTFLARWLAGELSDEERQAFEESEEFAQFKDISQTTAAFQVPAFDADAGFDAWKKNRVLPRENVEQPSETKANVNALSRIQRFALVASIIVSALVGAYLIQGTTSSIVEYQTGIGEQTQLILPDGSEVILNANSKLTYDEKMWDKVRSLSLTGEAFFKVASGDQFEVNTPIGSVSVIGTEFNVKYRDSFFDASCYEGTVAVRIGAENNVLTAGQEITFQRGKKIEQRSFQQTATPGWSTGIVNLTEVPLAVVFSELEAQFGVIVTSAIPEGLIYTGSFPTNNVESAIRLVMEPFGFTYQYNPQTQQLTFNTP